MHSRHSFKDTQIINRLGSLERYIYPPPLPTHTHAHNSYMPLIGIHGRMHPNCLPLTPFHHLGTLWSPPLIQDPEISLYKLWLVGNGKQSHTHTHSVYTYIPYKTHMRNLLLFYSLPVLKDVLPPNYLQVLTFVIGCSSIVFLFLRMFCLQIICVIGLC